MKTRTIEIEDTLPELVKSVIEDVEAGLISYLNENPDADECQNWGTMDYYGALHEMIDSTVPVYTSEIRDIFYLHGEDVEAAFDDAGIGEKKDDGWPAGWKAAAIYCYLEREATAWFGDNAERVFDEWKAARAVAEQPA